MINKKNNTMFLLLLLQNTSCILTVLCKFSQANCKNVLIFAGTNFRESKINAFRGYLFSRINTDFLKISLFYVDFDGISEKSTFRGYLISRNQQKFAKLAKICTREN